MPGRLPGRQGMGRGAIGAGSGNPDAVYGSAGDVAPGLMVAAFPRARGESEVSDSDS